MSDTFHQRAHELRVRAASEYDPSRQRYQRGLARSYEELARQRGELPERVETPAMAQRADLAAELRVLGYSLAWPRLSRSAVSRHSELIHV